MNPNPTQKAGEYLRTLVHGALRRLGLALASDLETECERGRFMETTLTTYSACIDRLTDENKTLRAQNMNLVRDAVALKLDPPPQAGGVSDRVREALGRLREDRAKFRADLDRRLEQTRQMAAKREPPPPFGPTPIVHPRQNGDPLGARVVFTEAGEIKTDTVPLSGHVLAPDIPLSVPVISTKGYDTSGKGDYIEGPAVAPYTCTLPPHPDWVNPDGTHKPVPDLDLKNGRSGIDPASFGGGARAPDVWPPAFFADTPALHVVFPDPAPPDVVTDVVTTDATVPAPRAPRKRKPAIKPDSDDDAA